MNRRFEAGPALLLLAAVLLLISLFLDWYDDVLNAWEAFELADLVLAALAIGVAAAAAGFFRSDVGILDRRFIPAMSITALAIVVSQLLDAPPAVPGDTLEAGAWLAFAATIVMALGALLTFGHVSLQVRVDGRDPGDAAAPGRPLEPTPAARAEEAVRNRRAADPEPTEQTVRAEPGERPK